jgi:hypothetical protein
LAAFFLAAFFAGAAFLAGAAFFAVFLAGFLVAITFSFFLFLVATDDFLSSETLISHVENTGYI